MIKYVIAVILFLNLGIAYSQNTEIEIKNIEQNKAYPASLSGEKVTTSDTIRSNGNGVDGNALKEIGQGIGDGAGTNTSGFSAMLAGHNNVYALYFNQLGQSTGIWSSTIAYAHRRYTLHISSDSNYINSEYTNAHRNGFSVRCVKD
ncbi:MAG: FISUMP domain-containing protein [Bacteroidota bacterium]|nr:FISUMP domain-containing protein [Bacteroidota bacterium]